MIDKLIELKTAFQNGNMTFEEFTQQVRFELGQTLMKPDADKVLAYNKLARMVICDLAPTDSAMQIDGTNMIYNDSDNQHYLWEETMKEFFGDNFFNFYNDLYEGG